MKRHTVNTKHPRYRVPDYPRGQGHGTQPRGSNMAGVTPPFSGQTFHQEIDSLAEHGNLDRLQIELEYQEHVHGKVGQITGKKMNRTKEMAYIKKKMNQVHKSKRLSMSTIRYRAINAGSHFFERIRRPEDRDVKKWVTYDKKTGKNIVNVKKRSGRVIQYSFDETTDRLTPLA